MELFILHAPERSRHKSLIYLGRYQRPEERIICPAIPEQAAGRSDGAHRHPLFPRAHQVWGGVAEAK